MLKPDRIPHFWKLIIVCFMSIKNTDARINVSIDNFNLTCGSRSIGPMDITFNNFNSQKIALIYINNKPNECLFSRNGSIYSIINTRESGCSVQDPSSPNLSFYAIVFLQEDRWFQRVTDPKFLFSCVYTAGYVKVRTAPLNILDTTWNIQDSRWNVVRGNVDMSYELRIYEDDGIYKRSILQAQFGQNIALKVSMSGTDQDEKGIHVRECVAISGGIEAQFIKNYCSSSTILPPNAGFVSNGTEALLIGLEAFRLAGSEDLTVNIKCLVDVCAYKCNGQNCRSHHRIKRESDFQQNISQVQAFGKLKVIGLDQPDVVTKDLCANVELISRDGWNARTPKRIRIMKTPVHIILIHHTAMTKCLNLTSCIDQIKKIQDFHMDTHGWSDIGYNFLVGEDGRVYEARGWNRIGAHTKHYNNIAIAISVIGNFMLRIPNQAALNAIHNIIDCGVQKGFIAYNYKLLGHRDVSKTLSPGDAFYEHIKQWPHYSDNQPNLYRNIGSTQNSTQNSTQSSNQSSIRRSNQNSIQSSIQSSNQSSIKSSNQNSIQSSNQSSIQSSNQSSIQSFSSGSIYFLSLKLVTLMILLNATIYFLQLSSVRFTT